MSNLKDKNSRIIFWLAILVWVFLFAASFVAFQMSEPTGDSFTRGLNRAGAFFFWQLVAGTTGLAIWLVYRRNNLGRAARWAARVPAIIFLLLIVALLALFVYGNSSRTLPEGDVAPTTPVTKPA